MWHAVNYYSYSISNSILDDQSVAAKYDTVEVLYLPNPKAVDQNKFYELLLNEEFKAFATK